MISSIIVLISCSIIAVSCQLVPQPPGFTMINLSGATGSFNSHQGYPTIRYQPGVRRRFVISAPIGQVVQLKIDPTNRSTFSIRPYDFAVMFEGSLASRVLQPCITTSYAALGSRDIDYLPVVMANTSSVRVYTSKSNVAVVDFCVDNWNSGADPTMLGFRAFWTILNGGIVQTTRPATTILRTTLSPLNPVPATKTCGVPVVSPKLNPNVRIVNGVNAALGSWPWACAMVDNANGRPFQFCGCTLINDQWIMTAGHCVAESSETQLVSTTTIYLGVNDLRLATKAKGNIFSIIRVVKNPAYDARTTNNDVALIKLATRVTFSPYLAPACLPTQPINAVATQIGTKGRRVCYVGGWGTLSQQQSSGFGSIGSGSDLLKQTSVEVFSAADCSALLNAQGISITTAMFCAGYDNGGFDSCQGDSGGPLVCEETDGSWTIDGIVSFGAGCAQARSPGVYSYVYNLRSFIDKTIASN